MSRDSRGPSGIHGDSQEPSGIHRNGEQVLNEIHDLICDRLPALPADDPVYPHLRALAPALAELLGHDRVHVVSRPEAT